MSDIYRRISQSVCTIQQGAETVPHSQQQQLVNVDWWSLDENLTSPLSHLI